MKSIGASSTSIVTPVDPVRTRIPADFFEIDRSRKRVYVTTSAGTSQWTLSSYALPDGSPLRSLSISKDGATLAADFKLSADGQYLYMTDNLLRITRFRTDTFHQDLQFQIVTDAPPQVGNVPETRHSLRVLDDAPESILVVTPASQMILYDRDQPRPYTTAEFPSLAVTVMDPVLVSSSYVYALQRADVYHKVPCLVRYSVDGLGFGPAEDFCNLATDWGKYPEMKVYSSTWVLENRGGAYGIRRKPDVTGTMRLAWSYDPSRDLVATQDLLGYSYSTSAVSYRFALTKMSTGEPAGHFPRATAISAFPDSAVFLDDDTLLYREQPSVGGSKVAIVPQWQAAAEWYP